MSKLTVLEYANKHQISKQAVYARIKKGSIESIIENDKTFVYDDIKEVKQVLNNNQNNDCLKFTKQLLKINKKLMKRNSELEDRLSKEQEKLQAMAMSYIQEMKSLYLPNPKTKKTKKKKK